MKEGKKNPVSLNIVRQDMLYSTRSRQLKKTILFQNFK